MKLSTLNRRRRSRTRTLSRVRYVLFMSPKAARIYRRRLHHTGPFLIRKPYIFDPEQFCVGKVWKQKPRNPLWTDD